MKTVFAYIVTKNYKHITAYNSHDFKNNQEKNMQENMIKVSEVKIIESLVEYLR